MSKPSRSEVRQDGGKNVFVDLDPIRLIASAHPVDLIISNSDGITVVDTKKERLDKQKWLSEALGRHRVTDITLQTIVKSNQMAIEDPENAFVHLYEVSDALKSRFDGEEKARGELDISKAKWDVIGKLANTKPLKQGRHRGNFAGVLRSAKLSELEDARKAVKLLIEKYLNYLERIGQSQ